ncbi:hypothetical protein ABFY09_06475 [Marinomonas sp. 5E14-1]|uniref:hypothetical protein n=1 Tax=Marinomonas sp. 5E14-1 TaxID=3153922 RepID=UPI003263066A
MKMLELIEGKIKSSMSYGIGVLFLIMVFYKSEILDFAENTLNINKASSIMSVLESSLDQLAIWGLLLILATFCINRISNRIKYFFKKEISPLIDNHTEKVQQQLEASSENTKSLLNARVLDTVISAASSDEIKNKIRDIHCKAYGSHCESDHGLFPYVDQKISKFYNSEKPHRSDYHQTVTIQDNDDESITWHEVCSYKLHTIALDPNYGTKDPNLMSVAHTVRYSSALKVNDLSLTLDSSSSDSAKYNLEVRIDDEVIFDSKEHLKIVGEKIVVDSIDGVEIKQENGTLEISITHDFTITNAWTNIEIKETSTIFDDYFISSRKEPTCGAKITINLPSTWGFELVKFGQPEDWNIHQHPTNTLSAWTKSWVLPGITFFCRWKKK